MLNPNLAAGFQIFIFRAADADECFSEISIFTAFINTTTTKHSILNKYKRSSKRLIYYYIGLELLLDLGGIKMWTVEGKSLVKAENLMNNR